MKTVKILSLVLLIIVGGAFLVTKMRAGQEPAAPSAEEQQTPPLPEKKIMIIEITEGSTFGALMEGAEITVTQSH